MAYELLTHSELKPLRDAAFKRDLHVRIDAQARDAGRPYLEIRTRGLDSAMTLSVHSTVADALAWLTGGTK
jgi:hypothetical protein